MDGGESSCTSKKGTMRSLGTPPPPPRATQRSDDAKAGVNVKVIVRCRPLSELERKDPSQFQTVSTKPETKEVFVSQTIPGRKIDSYSKTFTFDGVCNQFTTQRELFLTYIVPIVDEVLQGFNCTIFAYGQTGTGKTYTMEGDIYQKTATMSSAPPAPSTGCVLRPFHEASLTRLPTIPTSLTEQAGVIPRAVRYIFEALEAQDTEYSVRVSYLEIYNEELNDLLNDGDKQILRIYEDTNGKKGFSVDRLEEVPVNNPQDILNILSMAVKKRRTAETLLNRQSSRSHCIFSITIHMKETNFEGEDVIKIGKLNLVDLAGSENIQRSGANSIKDRAKEAGMINQSLLTLGRVINALVEHSSYVPYRDSKLTRLLQESLGGRTKTCIVATISPSSLCLEETLSTLDYAFRAKNIRNRPEINQKMTKRVMIRELNHEIERLKVELQANREKNGVYLPIERYTELETKLSGQAAELTDTNSEVARLRAEILQANQDVARLRDQLAAETNETARCRDEIATLQNHLQTATKEFRGWEHQIRQSCQKLLASINLFERESDILRSKLSSCRSGGVDQAATLRMIDGVRQETMAGLKNNSQRWEEEWKEFATTRAQSLCTDLLAAGEIYEGDMKRLVDEMISPIGSSVVAKMEAHCRQFYALVEQQSKEVDQIVATHATEVTSNQDGFIRLLEQQLNGLQDQAKDFSRHLHELWGRLSEADQRESSRVDGLCERTTSGIATLNQSVNGSLASSCSQLEKLKSEIQEAKDSQARWFREACEEFQLEMDRKIKQIVVTQSEKASGYMSHLSHACNSIMEGVATLQQSTKATLDEVPTTISELQSASKQRSVNLSSALDALNPLCKSFDQTTASCVENVFGTTQNANGRIASLLNVLGVSMKASSTQKSREASECEVAGKAIGDATKDRLADVSKELISQSKNINSVYSKQTSSFKADISQLDCCMQQTMTTQTKLYDDLIDQQDKVAGVARVLEALLKAQGDTPKHASLHIEVPLAGPEQQVWEPGIGKVEGREGTLPTSVTDLARSVKPLEPPLVPTPLGRSDSQPQPLTGLSAPLRPLLRSSSMLSRAGSSRRSASLTLRKKSTTESVSSAAVDLPSSSTGDTAAVLPTVDTRNTVDSAAPVVAISQSACTIQSSQSGARSPDSVSNGSCIFQDEEQGLPLPCPVEDASWSPSDSASYVEERPKRPAGSSRASSPTADSTKENLGPAMPERGLLKQGQARQSFAKPLARLTAQQQQQAKKRVTERGHQIKKRRGSSQSRRASP